MIKIENGKFYITCGDACKVLHADGKGRLVDVCFGKRVEFEDDLPSLGLVGKPDASEPEPLAFAATVRKNGKAVDISSKLVLKSAEVVTGAANWSFPVLRAEKSLKLVLECDGILAELYITPQICGGISERCALVNTGADPIEITAVGLGGADVPSMDAKSVFAKSDIVEIVSARARGTETAATIVTETGADARHGDAVGLYVLYGGRHTFGLVDGVCTRRVDAFLAFADGCKLEAGEWFETPELLCVYSDRGTDGLARAMHDIVRERLIPERFLNSRRPISFRMLGGNSASTPDAVKAIGRIGGDTFIAGADCYADASIAELAGLAEACDAAGVRLGAACVFESVNANSPLVKARPSLFTDKFTPTDNVRMFDLTRSEAREFIASRIASLTAAGVKHIVWESQSIADCGFSAYEYEYMKGFYSLLAELAERFPDTIFEGGVSDCVDLARLAYMPYYGEVGSDAGHKSKMFGLVPPCALAEYVMPARSGGTPFKTAFDIASLGNLSYICNPEYAQSEQLARAVRAQIFSYQDDAEFVVRGDLYRPYTPFGTHCYSLVSKDKSGAYCVYVNHSAVGADKPARIKLCGLDPHNLYYVRELGKTFSGAALVGYGVDVGAVEAGETAVFHLRQVADYE